MRLPRRCATADLYATFFDVVRFFALSQICPQRRFHFTTILVVWGFPVRLSESLLRPLLLFVTPTRHLQTSQTCFLELPRDATVRLGMLLSYLTS